ncbi:M28 family peptidase [Massilia atriviolacea]|uniref:Vacuolar membrane protease n=1 Tax=Massilia atriviolacea TaxID=2495579 RepID=A0A430HC54_9BURK|nr:M28 family peptidase [Massilia atriviolacea]RSZ55097.1 M28 family peptidase [Massilia atriviolacea]
MTIISSASQASMTAHHSTIERDSAGGLRLPHVLGALLALALLIVVSMRNLTPPAPLPASAPASVFSAGRAMLHLRHIAAAPHATGTPEIAAVRAYLLAELRAMGLQPEVQSAFAAAPDSDAAGYVKNIVVRLPGTVPGKAVMLSAHYDSVASGFGAADDGASVAAILETLRILAAGAPLRNDVIVLLSDGEEAGLLGAEAFVAAHPWARQVGLALNFEYRGNSGPMLMFETSAGNGRLIEAFGGLKQPVGNSLMFEIYKLLPNDTDLSAFKRGGLAGMNFAAMEGPTAYHTQLDRPEMLNQASLQHQGEIMLALSRHFGGADLGALKQADRIYFDVAGLGLVSYPAGAALPLAGLTLVLFGIVLARAVRSGTVRRRRVLLSAVLLPLVALAVALACTLLWLAISATHPQYKGLMDMYNSHWYWMGFVATAAGLFMALQSWLLRRFALMELALGAATLWSGLLLITALMMPGASFLLTWPLVPVLAAYAFLLSARGRAISAPKRLLVLLAAATPGVMLFAPLLRILLIAMTTRLAGVVVFLLVLLLGLMFPLLVMLKRRFLSVALPLAAGAALLAVGTATGQVSAEQPNPNHLSYIVDGKSDAIWMSSDAALDSWLKPILGPAATRRALPEVFGAHARPYWTAPAPLLGVDGPTLELLQDEVVGDKRTVAMRISSVRGAPEVKVIVEGTEVLSASMHGQPVLKAKRENWSMIAYGLPAEGTEVQFAVKAGRPFVLRVIDRSYGLPASVPARDKTMIAQPFGTSDSIRAVQAMSFQ